MEIFVKIIAENLKTGERYLAATSFLTFVALDADGKTVEVPLVKPETEEQKRIHAGAEARSIARKIRLKENQSLAESLSTDIPW